MINIAQIGVGYWGPNMLRNLVSNNDCMVKTVVDLDESRRDFVRGLYPKVKVSGKTKEVFSDPNIDAVVIATPVATHYDLTIQALKSKKHVLVEKPMATTVDEVEKIGELANEKNLIVMAGHTFLYNPAVRYVKKLIDSDELGDVRYIYCQRLSLGRIRSDVDALWNFAPHDISIIQYWLNDAIPIKVIRTGMAYVQNDVDDVVFLNIKYYNNIMANIHVSWLNPYKVRRITLVCSKKMIVYDDIDENKITIYDKGIDRMHVIGQNMDYDKINMIQFSYRSGDIHIPQIKWEEPLKVEIKHFIDCITKGVDCLTGIAHTKKVVRILSMATQ